MGLTPCFKKRVSDIDKQSDDNIAPLSLEEGEEEAVSDVTPTSEEAQPAKDSTNPTTTKSPSKSKK